MNLTCIRELIRKEFIQLFREKKNRPLLFVAPLLQVIIFGYVVSTDVKDVTIAVLDLAHTRESRMLIDEFNGNRTFRVTHVAENDHELEEYLLKRKVHVCLKIRPDFSEKIKKGDTSDIQILVDGSMSNISATRMAYISMLLNGFNKKMIRDRLLREMSYGRIDVRTRTWYNPNLDSYYFFVPGIVAFLVMLISLLFTSLAIIREKEAGTMEQLIVTPIKPMEFIAGKTIPYAIISFVQMIMVIVLALFWFRVPLEGSLLILFGVLLFLMSTLGIGLFISAISSTQQQAMMTTFFFILPFFMLSGLIFPIVNMPFIVRLLTLLNPLRYFLVIIRGVFLKGVGMDVLWPQFIGLFILGVVVFTGAIGFFKKRMD